MTPQEIKAENVLLKLGNILHALGVISIASWVFYVAYANWPENIEKLLLMCGLGLVLVGYLLSGLVNKLKHARDLRDKYDDY